MPAIVPAKGLAHSGVTVPCSGRGDEQDGSEGNAGRASRGQAATGRLPDQSGSFVVAASDEAHAHDHGDEQIYKGYFEDSQIAPRTLAHGNKSAAEYKTYYEVGYRTDVDRITIDGDTVTFYRDGTPVAAAAPATAARC